MCWRLGAAVCAIYGHREALWSNCPTGPAVVCLRCHTVLQRLL